MAPPIGQDKGEPNPVGGLRLARKGEGVDPRLLEIVRVLARRAAREDWERHVSEHRARR